MNETPKNNVGRHSLIGRFFRWLFRRQTQKRALIGLAALATLVAIFYLEEDWHGKRAWENCKRELEAKGAVLDWNKYIPPPVPDDQNFFKAPKMADWFIKPHALGSLAQSAWNQTNELGQHLDAKYPFDTAKRNASSGPVEVARIFFAPPNGTDNTMRFDNPATGGQVRELIGNTIGPSSAGSQGLTLTAKQLSQIQPVQIGLRADNFPSVDEIASLLGTDVVSKNLGNLRVENSVDGKSFRVLLVPHSSISAADYLAWSEQAVPDFDLIREALKRPCAQMDGDYSQPFEIPIVNYIAVRATAQTLDQRARCYLLLGQPEKALREVTLMHDLCHLLEGVPTGKPLTLVAAMINVAVTGLYVSTISDGFRLHAWQEPQLAALEKQLAEINLAPVVALAFKIEPAAVCRTLETANVRKFMFMPSVAAANRSIWQKIKDLRFHLNNLAPRGWVYQNMATIARLENKQLDGFDSEDGTILPGKVEALKNEIEKMTSHFSPYTFLAAIAVPNAAKAMQTLADNQTLANEAQIVCALERYHLAHGEYPETLDALVPQFIEKLPHDIIGGQPLHYRRDPPSQGSGATSGKFLLYSVGWNETDDGGEVVLNKDGSEDRTKGDWVWKN